MTMTPEKRAELVERGICTNCQSRPSRPDRKTCQVCADKFREYQRSLPRSKKHEYGSRWQKRVVRECLDAYGGVCVVCGEPRPDALLLHHSNHDGKEHRKSIPSGAGIYQWLRKNGYPDDLGIEVMCGTCHLIYHRRNPVQRKQ